ncbi:geranylgeranyl transferase type-1 subunit beta [Kickxella alabastrina]|nr:geranylgeranyl transferase type-1 subunit beta [Kickxella alabastrina]
MSPDLAVDKHVRYFKTALNMLPSPMVQLDSNRMTIAHLSLVGLAALGRLESAFTEAERHGMIEWIYEQQVHPATSNSTSNSSSLGICGFRGGSLFGPHNSGTYEASNLGNVASTYSALSSLLLLGDDLGRVNRRAIIGALRYLQLPSGSFAPHLGTTESDPRFIYCACAVSRILGDWSGVDQGAATRYIVGCTGYDGGLSQAPLQESHGGHLYCCIASLALMDQLDALPDRRRTLQWALLRLNQGYQGRIGKLPDVCYSFWVGASVEILGGHEMVDPSGLEVFTLSCEAKYGGVAKCPGNHPDPLHAALGIVGFAFFRDELPRMEPMLLLPEELVRAKVPV